MGFSAAVKDVAEGPAPSPGGWHSGCLRHALGWSGKGRGRERDPGAFVHWDVLSLQKKSRRKVNTDEAGEEQRHCLALGRPGLEEAAAEPVVWFRRGCCLSGPRANLRGILE